MSIPALRTNRVQEIVGAVARQALLDRGCTRIALLDDHSPEAELASQWLSTQLSTECVVRVSVTDLQVESVLHLVCADFERQPDTGDQAGAAAEVRRLRANLLGGALPANPVNKTALLLGGHLPPEPLLPLGDLYATEIRELAGGWSAPAPVRAIADACGGIELLDEALRRYLDGRDPTGLHALSGCARQTVEAALARGRASRLFGTVVPKIGGRTVGVDLFE